MVVNPNPLQWRNIYPTTVPAARMQWALQSGDPSRTCKLWRSEAAQFGGGDDNKVMCCSPAISLLLLNCAMKPDAEYRFPVYWALPECNKELPNSR